MRAVGFKGSPLTVRRKEDGSLVVPIENSLACIDLEGERIIKSLDELHELVFATLDAFRGLGVKTVSMNGIKYYPDISNSRKYQRQYVEEYVAQNPDAFDTIRLVDLRGGFKDPIDGIVDFFVGKHGWMETDYRWPPKPRQPKDEKETISEFNG